MRVSPQAEWGESPRESVTVMRPWGDKSGQLRAMQGLCHDRSRRNTSCQVYCIRAVHWPHGFFVCSGTNHIAVAEAMQQDFAALGIEVTIQSQDWNVFLQERKNGNYDFCREGWLADFNDPINMLEMWITTSGNNDCQFGRTAE